MALLFDSATGQPDMDLRAAPVVDGGVRLGRITARLRNGWQMAVVFACLLAAMTPQVRRALMTLDRG